MSTQAKTTQHARPKKPTSPRERGVALITVLVMMLLSLLLVMGGSRVGLLNERVAGNSADYQRAFEAAEALMADAKLDLASVGGVGAGFGTRPANNQVPCNTGQHANLSALLSPLAPPCINGVCNDLGAATSGNPATSFWSTPATLATFTANGVAARFGQFTGFPVNPALAVNPLLAANAWYWIEVLPYDTAVGGSMQHLGGREVAPATKCPFIFRVTVVAQGRRPGTQVVLQGLHFFTGP